jgi:hypothetical protein
MAADTKRDDPAPAPALSPDASSEACGAGEGREKRALAAAAAEVSVEHLPLDPGPLGCGPGPEGRASLSAAPTQGPCDDPAHWGDVAPREGGDVPISTHRNLPSFAQSEFYTVYSNLPTTGLTLAYCDWAPTHCRA